MGNILSYCMIKSCCPFSPFSNHLDIDSLPINIYHNHLFSYLDLDDIMNLRLLNQRFNLIVKSYEIEELSFLDHSIDYYINHKYKDNWFSTTKSTKRRNLIDSSKLSLLKNPSTNLLDLKFLRILQFKSMPIKLKDLNIFTKLQILIIEMKHIHGSDHLKLPDLQAFSIMFISYGSVSLVIDTPNLRYLDICDYDYNWRLSDNQIKFKHPSSLKYLKLSKYDESVSMFNNLEVLELYNCFSFSLKIDVLFELNNLKKLCIIFQQTEKLDQLSMNKLKSVLKDGLDVVFNGVNIRCIDKFEEYYKHLDLDFQMNNYANLEDNLHFVNYIDSGCQLFRLDNKLFPDLFRKYTNIRKATIKAAEVENWDRFVELFQNCPNLYYLETKDTFNQLFYDDLSTISSLSILIISENDQNSMLNIDFVMNMPFLINLRTSQDVIISKNLNLDNLKYLKWFGFEIDNQEIKVKKGSKGRFIVRNCLSLGIPYQDSFNLKELIQLTNYLRSAKK